MESIEKTIPVQRVGAGAGHGGCDRAVCRPVRRAGDYCVVVLDDDPTGIQTVHGVPVYMNWQEADVDAAVRDEPVFYIQTNTRGEVESACREINRALAARLAQAARLHGKTLSVVSRSDSAALALSAGDADPPRDAAGGRPARL